MHNVDLLIIALAACGLLGLALVLRRQASQSLESYFLGSRNMRWWLLGASGMASNVDMAGTMVIASLLFVFGLNGFWIELRGGLVLTMAFYLVYMGKWTRRSGCMTVAEWMTFRFGNEQGHLPRLMNAVFNVVFFIWAMAYFAKGAVKFFDELFPGDPLLWSIGLIAFVTIYTGLSGLPGVVWTDVCLAGFFVILAGVLAVKAYTSVDPVALAEQTGGAWSTMWPPTRIEPPPGYEDFAPFAFVLMFYFIKNTIDGMSGAGGYLAQRYFAASSERDCGLLSLLWIGLMSLRWPLMAAIALLGLTMTDRPSDPELVLPHVLREHLPIGLRGLMVTALLGAAMSTYSSFINASVSYVTRDLYQPLVNPEAGTRELMVVNHLSTVVLTGLGIALAMQPDSINALWDWINMGLGAGLIVPNAMRWYWWRMNGYGYASGAGGGLVAALAIRWFDPGWGAVLTFSVITAVAALAVIVGSLLTKPVASDVVRRFYEQTRPFGWWRPYAASLPSDQRSATRAEHRRDAIALSAAIPWQLALFAFPMAIVAHAWDVALVWLGILTFASLVLYRFWYRWI